MNINSGLYSTYDRASERFGPPFLAPHSGVAIRGFTDAVTNPERNSDISNHPDDFDLFHVGDFDSSTGIIVPLDKPVLVVQGKQVAIQKGLNV
jgi:hypothetical protein